MPKTITELAQLLNITPRQVHYAIKKSYFPKPINIGLFQKNKWQFTDDQVQEILNKFSNPQIYETSQPNTSDNKE